MISVLAALVIAVQPAPVPLKLPPDGNSVYSVGPQGEDTKSLVDISWTWDRSEKPVEFISEPSLTCFKECLGEKHFVHAQCNDSCDAQCPTEHRGENRLRWRYVQYEGDSYSEAADKFGVKMDEMAVFTRAEQDSGMDGMHDNPALTVKWNYACWNEDPCSDSRRALPVIVEKVKVISQFYRLNIQPDGSTTRTQGPKVVATHSVQRATSNPETKSPPHVSCRCELIVKDGGVMADPPKDVQVAMTGTTADGTVRALTGSEIKELDIQVVAEDMNHAELSCNASTTFQSISCPAGWELQCVDGSAQDTQIVENLTLPTGQVFLASLVYGGNLRPKVDAFTMCLNIKKKEPNKKLKYRLQPPSTPWALRSAQYAAKSPRRGPWDQVRTWIIMDTASYDAIAKVLVPPPSPATYMRELKNADEIGSISAQNPKVLALYETDFLAVPGVEEPVMRHFLATKLAHDRAATLAWIRASGKVFGEWFGEARPKVVASSMAALIARLSLAGDDATMAALELLQSQSLAEHKNVLKESGAIGPFLARMCSPCTPALEAKIGEVFSLYGVSKSDFKRL